MRVEFEEGKQRKFIQEIMMKTNSPSLKELSSRMQVSYSTLKNYFNESRTLPKSLFDDLCFAAKISSKSFVVEILNKYWGQVKGGKVCKRCSS